jgi:uncharacterized protein YceK
MHRVRRRLVLLLLAALGAAGCGSVLDLTADPGPERQADRTIEDASEVELATSGELVLSTGDAPALTITAGADVLPRLTSEVRDGRLVLGVDGPGAVVGEVRYDLVLPAARLVELSGSGTVRVEPPSALEELVLSGSGAIGVTGLGTDALTVELSGSGQIAVEGEAARQTVSIDGSGTYDGSGLDSEDAEVRIGGSGSADVTVAATLLAVVEGSGTITYAGDAAVQTEIDGSGTVTRR